MCGFVVSLTNKRGDVSPGRVAIAAACERMVPRGMVAFFIWDTVALRGFAARDPYGIEPLYYAMAFRHFADKRLLAQAPTRPLSEFVITRRKTGFGIPVESWLAQQERRQYGAATSRGWARKVAGVQT